MIGKGNQIRGTFSDKWNLLRKCGGIISTETIFQSILSKKNQSLTKNKLSAKLNLFCLQGITSIGLGPTDPTVILQKQEVLEVLL